MEITNQNSKLDNIETIIFDLGGTLKVSKMKEVFPETVGVLEKISKKYKLVIGANQPLYAYEFLDEFGIKKYFDKIYLSGEIGFKKPDPMFFQYILNDLKLKANEVMMVGDDYRNDIEPARKLGIKTIWMNYLEQEGKADYIIKNIEEILRIL